MSAAGSDIRRRLALRLLLLGGCTAVATAALLIDSEAPAKWLIFAGAALTAIPLTYAVIQLSWRLRESARGEDSRPPAGPRDE